MAPNYSIGDLQSIRADLKRLKRRPGSRIFTDQTTFDDWAFHHGGRKELQFNIGYVDDHSNSIRHGVAFSFELSLTLPSIDTLIPKVKLFNDYISLNVDEFKDMRLWYYNPARSVDLPPMAIPSDLIKEGVFVFLGNRQPIGRIHYAKILEDFDRLLPLYRYVESGGKTVPVSASQNAGFVFKAGRSKKATFARANLSERELDIDLRHNLIQDTLYEKLVSTYGVHNVRTEQPSGVGTLIDIVVKFEDDFWFYEIKTALTARACLRQAIGQLLEYGFWPGSQEPNRFIVVGESPLDKDAQIYLARLREKFHLKIDYEVVRLK